MSVLPQLLNGIGVVGLCLLFVIALTREWIVTGKSHRAEVSRLDARANKDADTIAVLSNAVTEQKATETATARILTALRDIVSSGASAGGI